MQLFWQRSRGPGQMPNWPSGPQQGRESTPEVPWPSAPGEGERLAPGATVRQSETATTAPLHAAGPQGPGRHADGRPQGVDLPLDEDDEWNLS